MHLKEHKVWIVVLVTGLALLALAAGKANASAAGSADATITVNGQVTYQTMEGWEATAQAGQDDFPAAYPLYKDALFTAAANDLGINRLRLETRRKGNGFDLAALDSDIEKVVLPLRQRLQARGEKLWVNLCVVRNDYANAPSGPNGTGYDTAALALMQHMQSKYGFVPDSWEVALEPDNFQWGGIQHVTDALLATAKLFQQNGLPYQNYFVVPSDTNADTAVNDIQTAMNTLGQQQATGLVREFSYHRYSIGPNTAATIANLGVQYGKRTAMLEHIGSSYPDLYQDLTAGRNSAWQQYTLAYTYDPAYDGAEYYVLDLSNPGAPKVQLDSRAKYLRQYFHYVRSGAVRIEAQTNNGAYAPVAFINSASNAVYPGKWVVVVQATGAGGMSVAGLPGGTYGVEYTTAQQAGVSQPDVTIAAGQALNTSIPAAGVLTIYGKSGGTPPTPTPTACNTRPDRVLKLSPTNAALVNTTRVRLAWKPIECADSYTLQIRKRLATGPWVLNQKGIKDSGFAVTLANRKKYAWRVKACNRYGCTASDWWTFKVIATPGAST